MVFSYFKVILVCVLVAVVWTAEDNFATEASDTLTNSTDRESWNSTDSSPKSIGGKDSTGTIVGAVVACFVGVTLIAIIVIFLHRKCKRSGYVPPEADTVQ